MTTMDENDERIPISFSGNKMLQEMRGKEGRSGRNV